MLHQPSSSQRISTLTLHVRQVAVQSFSVVPKPAKKLQQKRILEGPSICRRAFSRDRVYRKEHRLATVLLCQSERARTASSAATPPTTRTKSAGYPRVRSPRPRDCQKHVERGPEPRRDCERTRKKEGRKEGGKRDPSTTATLEQRSRLLRPSSQDRDGMPCG